MRLPLIGQSYTMPSINLDFQSLVNGFLVYDPTGKSEWSISPVSGSDLFSAQIGTQCSVRAMAKIRNKLYAVVDNVFYEIYPTGVRKELGKMKGATNRARIIDNQNQILIADGDFGYVYQLIKTDARDVGDFFQVEKTSSFIGEVTFTGSGLDDMDNGGIYTGTSNKTYRVEIQEVPATPPDKFRWSDTDGATWNAENIAIVAGDYTLNDGVTIQFSNTSGHTKGDYWSFDVEVDESFYPPVFPSEQFGFGIFPQQASNRFFRTEENDFSNINATNYAFASAQNDYLVAALNVREEQWLFCTGSIEIWYYTAGTTFGFERRQNLILNYGCAAAHSVALSEENQIFWLANSPNNKKVIVQCDGYVPVPISTQPINIELAKYDNVEDAFGWLMYEKGHYMYYLTIPSADVTFGYDIELKTWHKRSSRLKNAFPKSNEYREGRWLANCYAEFEGMNLIGDFQTGNIYKLNSDVFTENSNTMIFERTSQHVHQDNLAMYMEWIILDVEGGVGIATGLGSDPVLMFNTSKDSGHSWRGEFFEKMGKIGETRTRIKINRLGSSDTWTFRMRISDPVVWKIIDASAEVEVMPE